MEECILTKESNFPKAVIELENGSELLVSVDSGISGYFPDLQTIKIEISDIHVPFYTCHINVGN